MLLFFESPKRRNIKFIKVNMRMLWKYHILQNHFQAGLIMGCCGSIPRKQDKLTDRFGLQELQQHFLAKIKIDYLSSLLPQTEQSMLKRSQLISSQRAAQIQRKQQAIEAKINQQITKVKAHPQKAHEYQVSRNMSIQQIFGLDSMRRKFVELKGIVAKNVKSIEQEMIKDVRFIFDFMESKIREKIIHFGKKQQPKDLQEFERSYRENKAEVIKEAKLEVDSEIRKRVNFDNFSKRFISVVPLEQLMALTMQHVVWLPDEVEVQPIQHNDCCCP